MGVVLAAYGLSFATIATHTDDGDRRAVDAQKDIQVVQDDAEQTKEKITGLRASRLDAVAALDGTSVALASRNRRSGCGSSDGDSGRGRGWRRLAPGGGDRKDNEEKDGKDGGVNTSEHVD